MYTNALFLTLLVQKKSFIQKKKKSFILFQQKEKNSYYSSALRHKVVCLTNVRKFSVPSYVELHPKPQLKAHPTCLPARAEFIG